MLFLEKKKILKYAGIGAAVLVFGLCYWWFWCRPGGGLITGGDASRTEGPAQNASAAQDVVGGMDSSDPSAARENADASGSSTGADVSGAAGASGLSTGPDTADDTDSARQTKLAVHVSGAVKKPDRVFFLPEGSRVIDAVEAAGGAAQEADLSLLNLAEPVFDGEKIYVPREGEEPAQSLMQPEEKGDAKDTENPQKPLTNINLATTIELQELPGIGETYAKRIVEYRETNGLFETIEDIKNVSGIGENTFEKIKDRITVSP